MRRSCLKKRATAARTAMLHYVQHQVSNCFTRISFLTLRHFQRINMLIIIMILRFRKKSLSCYALTCTAYSCQSNPTHTADAFNGGGGGYVVVIGLRPLSIFLQFSWSPNKFYVLLIAQPCKSSKVYYIYEITTYLFFFLILEHDVHTRIFPITLYPLSSGECVALGQHRKCSKL